MRWIVAAGLASIISVLGFIYASPHIALHQLRSAIRSGDPVILEERINFSRLRENLKEQLNAVVLKEGSSDLVGNPFAGLGLALVTKLVDGAVDSFVTPAGLAGLARGNQPEVPAPTGPDVTAPDADEPPDDLFAAARITRDSMNRFSAWVPNEDGQETRFVFWREGLSWRLSNIFLPIEAILERPEPPDPESVSKSVPPRILPLGFISSPTGADIKKIPSDDSDVIRHIAEGHRVKLAAERGEWQQIVVPDLFDARTGTLRGWVRRSEVTPEAARE